VQTKRVDYSTLDDPSSPARIRLNSTAVRVQHVGEPARVQFDPDAREVEVLYVRAGKTYRVRAKDVVLACNNAMIPYLCTELPDAQKTALHQAVRAVNQATNVLLRDFRAFAALKASSVACPNCFYDDFSLMLPIALGDLQSSRDPSEPILIQFRTAGGILANEATVAELTHGNPPKPGTPVREQFRILRAALLTTPFETFERAIRTQMARALAGSGFDPARDIVAITVNRWPHGYAMGRNALFDRAGSEEDAPCIVARQKFGHIAIANSDASGIDLVQNAFDEAFRAVRELEPRRSGWFERI
jgi:spermidine dehydrogenase